MLIRMLLLLLCVFTLSSSTFNYHIDYSRCYTDMKCAVRESCIQGKSATAVQSLTFLTAPQKLIDGCDVIIQIRTYTEKKFLMMIQINASKSAEDVTTDGVEFAQGQFKLKCENKGVSGDAAYEIKTLEAKHADKVLFCSFTIRAVDDNEIENKFTSNELKNEIPVLKFKSEASHELKTQGGYKGKLFWRAAYTTNCNPDVLLTNAIPDSTYLVDQLDTTLSPPLSCASSQQLRIVNDAGKTLYLDKGEAIKCDALEWKYKNGSELTVVNSAITAHCVEKFCTLCDSLEQINCGAACSTPSNNAESDICKPRAGSACPNSQWVVDGDSVVIVKSITCEKDKDDRENRKAAWYMDIKGSSERVKVTKAACYDKSVCWTAARLVEKCDKVDPAIMECTSFIRTSDDTKINCTDGFTLMHSYGGVIPTETTSLTCNFQTGNFNDGNSTEIKSGTTVYCGRKKEKVVEQVAAAGFDPMIGVGVGGLILLIIIAVIVVVVIRRRREAAEPHTNKVDGEASGQPTQSTTDKSRGPWLARNRALPPIPASKMEHLKLTPEQLEPVHFQQFIQYDVEMRRKIFCTYFANTDPHYLEMFWRYFRMFEERNMDCMIIWEMTWRLIRLMDGKLKEVDSVGVNINVSYRKWNDLLRNRLLRFALPIASELLWTIQPGEHPTDTWMRFLVMRILLWAEEPVICRELKRLSTVPIDQLESPMRAVVLQYAVRHLDQGRELMDKFWKKHVIADPVGAAGDQFGTIRQHLLYALASHDTTRQTLNANTNKMEDDTYFTRKVLTLLDKPETVFSPQDWYWAYRGATEYHSSRKIAVRLFHETAPSNPLQYEEIRDRQLDEKCKNMTPAAKAAMKKEWMESSVATASMMLESCLSPEQLNSIWMEVGNYLSYCDAINPDVWDIIPAIALRDRAINYGKLYKDVPKEDVFRDFEKYLRASNPPQ